MLSPALPPTAHAAVRVLVLRIAFSTQTRSNKVCRSIAHSTKQAQSIEVRRQRLSCHGKSASLYCMVLCHCAFSVHHTSFSILRPIFGRYRSPSLLLRMLALLSHLQRAYMCMNCRSQTGSSSPQGGHVLEVNNPSLYRKFTRYRGEANSEQGIRGGKMV